MKYCISILCKILATLYFCPVNREIVGQYQIELIKVRYVPYYFKHQISRLRV